MASTPKKKVRAKKGSYDPDILQELLMALERGDPERTAKRMPKTNNRRQGPTVFKELCAKLRENARERTKIWREVHERDG